MKRPVTNYHVEPTPPWSPEAEAIIDFSGIEPAYQDILDAKEKHDAADEK